MKLPLLVRLTLAIAIWCERIAWAAWGLHDRVLTRARARIAPMACPVPPSLRAEIESRSASPFVTTSTLLLGGDDLRLKDGSGEVIAEGAGMVPFKIALATYQNGRPN